MFDCRTRVPYVLHLKHSYDPVAYLGKTHAHYTHTFTEVLDSMNVLDTHNEFRKLFPKLVEQLKNDGKEEYDEWPMSLPYVKTK